MRQKIVIRFVLFAFFHLFFLFIFTRSIFFDYAESGFEQLKYNLTNPIPRPNLSKPSYVRNESDDESVDKIILLRYDRNDFLSHEGFKSSRNHIAYQSVQKLGSHPKAILLDFHLDDKGQAFASDVSLLTKVFEKSGKVVLDYVLNRDPYDYFLETDLSGFESSAIPEKCHDSIPRVLTFSTNLEISTASLLKSALDIGAADGILYERDDEFRRMKLFSGFRNRLYEDIVITLFRIEKNLSREQMNISFQKRTITFPPIGLTVPLDPYGQVRLDLRASDRRFRAISFSDLARMDPNEFNEKIVIVGVGTTALNADLHHTPAGIFAGPEIIATALYQFLSGRFFKEFPRNTLWMATTAICLLLFLIHHFWGKLSRLFTIAFFLGGVFIPLFAFCRFVYIEQSYFLTVLLLNHVLFLTGRRFGGLHRSNA